MILRTIVVGLSVFGGIFLATSANAADGWSTRAANMRTCASVRCPRILTIPARARVWVFYCERWCRVSFAGRRGFAHGRYIRITGYYHRPPSVIVPPPIYRQPPIFRTPPIYRRPPKYRRPPVFRRPPIYRPPRRRRPPPIFWPPPRRRTPPIHRPHVRKQPPPDFWPPLYRQHR